MALWALLTTRALPRLHRTSGALQQGVPPDAAEVNPVFSSIIPTLHRFFHQVFSIDAAAANDATCAGVAEVGRAAEALAASLVEAIQRGTATASTQELVPLSKLLPPLVPILRDLDFQTIADDIDAVLPPLLAELEYCTASQQDESAMTGGLDTGADAAALLVRRVRRTLARLAHNEMPLPVLSPSPSAVSSAVAGQAPARKKAAWLMVPDPATSLVVAALAPSADPSLNQLLRLVEDQSLSATGRATVMSLVSRVLLACRTADDAEGGAPGGLLDPVLANAVARTSTVAQQRRFDAVGLMRVAVNLASVDPTGATPQDPKLTAVALETATLAVGGGNETVQDSLMAYFNAADEQFFLSMRQLLRGAMSKVRRENQQAAQVDLLGADGDPRGAALVALSRNPGSAMYSLTHVDGVLQLLQQMCEGHHSPTQNYLRVQSDNVVAASVNMLQAVADLAEELLAHPHRSNVAVLSRVFAFFTEACQGPCSGNQRELLRNGGLCGLARRTFAIEAAPHAPDGWGCRPRDVAALHHAVATTLLAVLEGVRNPALVTVVLNGVPLSCIAGLLRPLRHHVPPSWVGRPDGDDDGCVELLRDAR